MKRIFVFGILLLWLTQGANSQSCTATSYNFDLSASIDTTVSVESNRNGDCCSGNNCIVFNLLVNPACSYVNFSVANPAPNGSAFYQINCGPPTSLATPACIVGMTNVTITFCKPGNDAPIYTITASGAIQGSADTTIKQGCTGKMGVKGLLLPTINWTSIYPGPPGAYNSYLSCIAGCDTVNVTPQQGAPAYIDYQVSGNRLCGGTVFDTIRIYTEPRINVVITPTNPMICPNGGAVTLAAAAAGEIPGYNFSWNTGDTTSIITVAAAGMYTVAVSDLTGCLPVLDTVVVNPLPVPPAPVISTNAPLCAGSDLNLSASLVSGATYSWTGPNGFTSNQQNITITNAGAGASGIYTVTATVNGCTSVVSNTNVTINSIPPAPVVTSNAPVCAGSVLNLSASAMANALYNWTGPNGFNSSAQNPAIANVSSTNAGVYNTTVTVNGCTSAAGTATVIVNQPAIVSAGNNQTVCSSSTFNLNGSVSGTNSGVWTTNGSGGFAPSNTALNATYDPSAADKMAGSVVLTLTSTNNGACAASASSTTISFAPAPTAMTGNDTAICVNSSLSMNGAVTNAAGGIWTTSGSGKFLPSNTSLNAIYIPDPSDTKGKVVLTLTTTGNVYCPAASKSMNVVLKPAPVVQAGSDQVVVENYSTMLRPIVSSQPLKISWSPSMYLDNPGILNPTTTPKSDITYQLTVTDLNGCSAADDISIRVLKMPVIPNVFTPNGDGINDQWQVKYLADFPDCDIEIFNRYGQLVFRSKGYGKPWDGTIDGKPLPAATYYYVINLKYGLKPLSGFVDIVR